MVCVVRAPPQSGGHIALLLLPPHTLEVKRTQSHTLGLFCYELILCYFLICLILWCKCSVLLSCSVQWGVSGGLHLGSWVGRRRFTFSCSAAFTSCFSRGDVLSVTFHSFRLTAETFFGKRHFCWNWPRAHSWLFSVCAVVFSRFLPVATI